MAITPETDEVAAGASASRMASSPRPHNGALARYAGFIGAAVLIAILARPMVVGRTFIGWDWYPHQWFIWHQAESLKATGLPTLFSHNRMGVFVPHYAFYGGTLYTFAGALMLVVGDAGTTMVILFILAFAACYGGWYWLGRQCGLGIWTAHAPAVLFITGPYYLGMIYCNGSMPEFIAISVLPPMAASALAILRARRLRAGPAAVLALSTTLFTGSHNITLLWGGTVAILATVVLLALVPGFRQLLSRGGVLRVAGIMLPAVLVNAWFLLPDIAYQSHTIVANTPHLTRDNLIWSVKLTGLSELFRFGRMDAQDGFPHLALQLPLLGGIWLILALVVLRPAWRTSWYRAIVLLIALMAGLIMVMSRLSWIDGLPRPYNLLQFSYRLEAYIMLAFAGAMIGVLVLLRRSTRRRALWAWVLVPVLAIWVVGAVGQLRQKAPSTLPEIRAEVPYMTDMVVPGSYDYATNDFPEQAFGAGSPVVGFPNSGERNKPATRTLVAYPGTVFRTNIITMPQLVHIDGAKIVGREHLGQAVLQLDDDVVAGAAVVTVRAAHPWPVVGGWILSIVGLAALALNGIAIAWVGVRRRRAGSASP